MKVFAFACIIFAVCISTSLQWTPFYQCYDKFEPQPVPVTVRVEGCRRYPCEFIDRTNLTAQWDFVAQTNARSLIIQVNVLTNTTAYEWKYNINGCQKLSKGSCPLRTGEVATYNLTMFLFRLTTKYMPFWFEFRLLDEKKNMQMCFKMWTQYLN